MMKKIQMYTAQEKKFLQGVLELLSLEYHVNEVNDTISHTDYQIIGTAAELQALQSMLLANYESKYR